MSLVDQLQTRKSQQVLLLLALYARRNGDAVDPFTLGEELGIARQQAERATRYCEEEGLLQRHASDSSRVAITKNGVSALEAMVASPSKSTDHFPPLASLSIPTQLIPKVEATRRPSRAA